MIGTAMGVALLLTTSMASAVEPADREFAIRVNEANRALSNEQFDSAIAGYEAAEEIESGREETTYNKAVALYRKKDYSAALSLFDSVSGSLDQSLAAKARFNAGNCRYVSVIGQEEQDPATSIEQLQRAIADFRGAIALNPTDSDARTNIELAAKLLKQMQDQEQQDQEQQDQKQQDQKQQDQKQQDQKQQDQKQQDQDQQDQEQQDQEQQNQGQQDQDQQDQDQQNQEQQNQGQQDQGQQDQGQQDQGQQDQGQQDQGQQDQDQQDQGQQDQGQQDQSDEKQMDQSTESDQGTSEAEAPSDSKNEDGSQEPPQGQLSSDNEPEDAIDQQQPETATIQEGEITEQEARKMLQAIRDRDLLRRYRREREQRSRHVPVDRDW
ncbi:hypothetical protein [Stieleria tagensis]|uniref:hypothetical protein n=1 Tax=Stieleria tagensis TaxID=2956795 RepID=UPI00209AA2FE|nr:hypothetical protein [Stieleria tagensis]